MSDKRRLGEMRDDEDEREARLAALSRFIVWAEREAVAVGAADCSICLQLARVALQSKIDQVR